ncbi:hypothetical protein BC831DRAFT_242170 [Entophlyctis helioformis]|nr:hypothetical protein BC831DRAFT_242170 [Entophlyctis helioformis]
MLLVLPRRPSSTRCSDSDRSLQQEGFLVGNHSLQKPIQPQLPRRSRSESQDCAANMPLLRLKRPRQPAVPSQQPLLLSLRRPLCPSSDANDALYKRLEESRYMATELRTHVVTLAARLGSQPLVSDAQQQPQHLKDTRVDTATQTCDIEARRRRQARVRESRTKSNADRQFADAVEPPPGVLPDAIAQTQQAQQAQQAQLEPPLEEEDTFDRTAWMRFKRLQTRVHRPDRQPLVIQIARPAFASIPPNDTMPIIHQQDLDRHFNSVCVDRHDPCARNDHIARETTANTVSAILSSTGWRKDAASRRQQYLQAVALNRTVIQ